MQDSPESALVRVIHAKSDQTVGVGVLVGRDQVVTCAHVVNAVHDRSPTEQSEPAGKIVRIEFVQLPGVIRQCTVESWVPPAAAGFGGDVAGLRLAEAAPDKAAPARFANRPPAAGTALRVFGYPQDPPRPDGMWVDVQLKGEGAGSILQVNTVAGEPIKAQPGFSGAPIWDGNGLVVGVFVGSALAENAETDAYALPPAATVPAWKKLLNYITRPPNPYVGLAPFTLQQSEYFFGRDEDASNLAALVRQFPVVAVVGKSGVGKSSLVRAGLVRELNKGRPPGTAWTVAAVRPGTLPWSVLAAELARVANNREPTADEVSAKTAELKQDGLGPTAAALAGLDRPLLVIVDQFEELLADPNKPPDPALVDMLLPGDDAAAGVHVVITMRTDVLEAWAERSRLAGKQIFSVWPLSQAQRKVAVQEPAAKLEVDFQPGLVEKIVADTTDDSLPLLQFVLANLWKTQEDSTLGHDAYTRLGGVSGFLSRFAEERSAELSPESDDFKDALLRLVASRKGGDGERIFIRRRAERSSMPGNQWRVLERLANASLVNIDLLPNQEPFAELAHERLITAWDRLNALANKHADFLDWKSWIEQRMADNVPGESDGARADFLPKERIEEAEAWIAREPNRVSDSIREFVAESKQILQEQVERLEAALARSETLRTRSEALRLAIEAELALRSARARTSVALALALESLKCEPSIEGEAALRSALAVHRPTVAVLHPKSRWIAGAVAFSPNGAVLATSCADGVVRLFDASSGDLKHTISHQGPVSAIAFSGDGTRLAAVSERRVSLVSVDDFELVDQYEHRRRVTSLAVSADGRRVVSGDVDGMVHIRDTNTHQSQPLPHEARVDAVALEPAGRLLATGSHDALAQVFDVASGRRVSQVPHSGPVVSVAFTPDGRHLASGSEDRFTVVTEADTGTSIHRLPHPAPVRMVRFDPDGKTLVTMCEDGIVRVFDMSSGMPGPPLPHDRPVGALAFGQAGTLVATGCEDYSARLYVTASGTLAARIELEAPVHAVDLGRGNSRLAAASTDGAVLLYDTTPVGAAKQEVRQPATVTGISSAQAGPLAVGTAEGVAKMFDPVSGRWTRAVTGLGWPVNDIAISADGNLVGLACDDGFARLWNLASDTETDSVRHTGRALCVALSADGRLFASGGLHGSVVVKDGNDVRRWPQHHLGAVRSLALDADGSTLLSGGIDRRVKLLSLAAGNVVEIEIPARVNAVALEPGGRRFVCGDDIARAYIFDAATQQEIATLDHDAQVRAVAYAPDGARIATGSDDQTVRLFDASGILLARYEFDAPVTCVCFDAGGATVWAAALDGTIRGFEVDRDELVRRAEAKLTRSLSAAERVRYGLDETAKRKDGA